MIWVKSPHLEDDPVNKKDGNDCEAFIVALRHVPLTLFLVFVWFINDQGYFPRRGVVMVLQRGWSRNNGRATNVAFAHAQNHKLRQLGLWSFHVER
jgi:hypothetical protein